MDVKGQTGCQKCTMGKEDEKSREQNTKNPKFLKMVRFMPQIGCITGSAGYVRDRLVMVLQSMQRKDQKKGRFLRYSRSCGGS